MLQNLHVKNLALIKEADVYFGDGLNILTGETGAGKSLIIGSVNIALGGKISKELLKEDDPNASVELVFTAGKKEKEILDSMGIDCEDDTIIISRKIVNGRSTSRINGESVSNSVLKSISGNLIDIHGQHDHQSLIYKSKHLEILDDFGKEEIQGLKNRVSEEYKKYTDLKKQLEKFDMDEEQRLRTLDFLQFEIDEIESAALQNGEDESLEEKYKVMSNSRKIVSGLSNAFNVINGDGQSALEMIGMAVRETGQISDYDDNIRNIYSTLMDIESMCQDVSRDMESYIDEMSFDEEEVAQVEERLDHINKIKSKYGNSLEDINIYLETKSDELQKLTHYYEEKQKLIEQISDMEKQLNNSSAKLSKLRKEYSKKLEIEITDSLKELNFLDVNFKVMFAKTENFTAKGFDEVEYMISTNPGEPVKSLSKVASGGELSRIMLAIKTILADADGVDAMIFDEIDTGISGRTAQMVSEKLSKLSKKRQVICITHLPQIASMADFHFLIEKSVENKKTQTVIRSLDSEERIDELSRMLGGAVITEQVRDNAREMIELAAKVKS